MIFKEAWQRPADRGDRVSYNLREKVYASGRRYEPGYKCISMIGVKRAPDEMALNKLPAPNVIRWISAYLPGSSDFRDGIQGE